MYFVSPPFFPNQQKPTNLSSHCLRLMESNLLDNSFFFEKIILRRTAKCLSAGIRECFGSLIELRNIFGSQFPLCHPKCGHFFLQQVQYIYNKAESHDYVYLISDWVFSCDPCWFIPVISSFLVLISPIFSHMKTFTSRLGSILREVGSLFPLFMAEFFVWGRWVCLDVYNNAVKSVASITFFAWQPEMNSNKWM